MKSRMILGIDVGGSGVKAAAVPESFNPGEVRVRNYPINSQGSAEEIVTTLVNIVLTEKNLAGKYGSLVGAGFGFPGPFDYPQGISHIQGLGKFHALYKLNLISLLRSAGMGELPVRFENDAEAAVMGEGLFGAGRGVNSLLGITLGTGIGSAFLEKGTIKKIANPHNEEGWLFPIPVKGETADDVFSTRGLMRRFHRQGIPCRSLPEAASRARQGERSLQRIFSQFGRDLGNFLVPLVKKAACREVLILGGIANTFDLFGESLSHTLPIPAKPGILKEKAAVLGAAYLFSQHFFT